MKKFVLLLIASIVFVFPNACHAANNLRQGIVKNNVYYNKSLGMKFTPLKGFTNLDGTEYDQFILLLASTGNVGLSKMTDMAVTDKNDNVIMLAYGSLNMSAEAYIQAYARNACSMKTIQCSDISRTSFAGKSWVYFISDNSSSKYVDSIFASDIGSSIIVTKVMLNESDFSVNFLNDILNGFELY